MASNGRKLLKCDKCDNEVIVAIESKSCVCSKCLIGGLSLSDMEGVRANNREKIKAKRDEKKAKKKAKKLSASAVISNGSEQPKKKRGRPRKNPIV